MRRSLAGDRSLFLTRLAVRLILQPMVLWAERFLWVTAGDLRRQSVNVLREPPGPDASHRLSHAYSIDAACDGVVKALEFVMSPCGKQKALN